MNLVTKRTLRALAAILAVLMLLPVFAGKPHEVYAADTVSLHHDTQYHYGKWSTGNLTVDDGTGTAFCVEPSRETPPNGSYPYELLDRGSNIRKVMYYLVGGNGYEEVTSKTLFSEYTYIDIYVTSHVMLSWMWDGCKWSGDADEGVGSEFKELIESLYRQIIQLPDPPAGYQAFVITGKNGYQTVVGSWPLQDVEVAFHKTSAVPAFSDGNPCYSLQGTTYRIYQTEADAKANQNAAGEVTIRADGSSSSVALKPGVYFYKEVTAGKGYALDPEIHSFSADLSDESNLIEVSDAPQYDPVELLIQKKDALREDGSSTGDAKLAGAEFTVAYYSTAQPSGSPKYTWVFKTDEAGKILFQEKYKVSGPSLPKSPDGEAALPLGCVTIQETGAPDGYLKNDTVFTVPVSSQGISAQVHSYKAPTVQEEVIRGGVRIHKHDRELGLAEAMGGADLKDIAFLICNASEHDVLAAGKWVKPGEEVVRLTTDEQGEASTASDFLPYGTYTIREVKTNDSYLLSDAQTRTFQIRENGVIVEGDRDGNNLVFLNQVKRNDISFHKIEDGTNKRMGLVAFLLTLEETGEEHVIVTNKNGYFSSVKSNVRDVNANDAVLAEGKSGEMIASDSLNPNAGLWFGKGQKGSVSKPDDGLGALPYGTYTLRELRCEANKGYELLDGITFYLEEDRSESPVLSLGTLTNDRQQTPEIHTTAADKETGTHYAAVKKGMTVVDTIAYSGLKPGKTYQISGVAKDPETGEDLLDDHGKPITAVTEYTPELSDGKVALSFTFDGESLSGKRAVFTEALYADDQTIAVHADLNDEAQTIYLLQIGTLAHGADQKSHMLYAGQQAVIVDEVRFEGLKPGETYLVEGTLTDRDTGKPLLIRGEEVRVSKEITPVDAKGTVEVSFDFDGSELAGTTVVVFERILQNDEVIAVHEDLTDEDQTIHFPQLQTTASDAGIEDKSGKRIIKDSVSYSNVVPGEELVITGVLIDKQSKQPLRNGDDEVTGKAVFVPDHEKGTQEVQFVFDDASFAGKELVAFERLYLEKEEKTLLASHEDINDAAQTVQMKKNTVPVTGQVKKTVTVKTETVPAKSPQTGDHKFILLYSLLACAAGLGLLLMYRGRRI